jgi:plastocyanin
MRRLLSAAGVVLLLAACGGGAGPGEDEASAATDRVSMAKSYRFEPEAVTVSVGSTVTWTNEDNFTHNVRIQDEVVGEAEPGQTVTHTFSTPGTFSYDCSLHPTDMKGVVTVE